MDRRWTLADPPAQDMRERFSELHPVAVQLLWSRGITAKDQVEAFLQPDYVRDLHDPYLFREMEAACARIWRALTDGENIVVYGDYDADGVTGSAVLLTTLHEAARLLGADRSRIGSYIPHREKEGYGVSREAVEVLSGRKTDLMITVDCGISCAPEIALAAERGIDTIVVDHHQVPPQVPECILIHPLVPGETYPFGKLAAVGVSFKLACGFMRYAAERGKPFSAGFDKWLLDLVAIATVTDLMPLVGENRTLEKYGLVVLNKTRRPGLQRILETAGLAAGAIDTVSVGFGIGPRINAASRMDHAQHALDALMAPTLEDAKILAEKLNDLNLARQRSTEEIMRAAQARLAAAPQDTPLRIVWGDGWSAGLVGLVAGKIASETGVPAMVFGREGERYVGSGRGVPGFNLVAALEAAKGHLTRFGGHPQACGMTVDGDGHFREFCAIVEEYARRELAGRDLRPVLQSDAEIRLSQVTWDLVHLLQKFEPHGEGNPRPRFLLRDLVMSSATPVGQNGRHVRLAVRGDVAVESKVIAFNLAEKARAIVPGSHIDLVVELGINVWNGRQEIQLKAIDLRLAQPVI